MESTSPKILNIQLCEKHYNVQLSFEIDAYVKEILQKSLGKYMGGGEQFIEVDGLGNKESIGHFYSFKRQKELI